MWGTCGEVEEEEEAKETTWAYMAKIFTALTFQD